MMFSSRDSPVVLPILFLLLASVVSVVLCARGNPNGILCYSCDSHFDEDCNLQRSLETAKIMNCSSFITDLNPVQLRCVRIISNTDARREVVIRRCAVVGDCKYIAKNEKQACHECAHDLCNGGK